MKTGKAKVKKRYTKMANKLKTGFVVAFSVVGALVGRAETLTWTGNGGDNKISTAANWNPQKTPAMGDRLVSDVSGLKFAAETIELTGEGLTFAPTAKIYFDNTFTGSGPLTIDGSNVAIVFDTVNSYAGGTVVQNGTIQPNVKSSGVFGSGSVTLNQRSTTRPYIFASGYAGMYPNDIILNGNGTAGSWVAIDDSNLSTIGGSISSDCDFTIQNADRGTTVTGEISAPGRTVTFKHTNTKGSGYQMNVKGAIDANVIVQAADSNVTYPHIVQFEGVSTGVDNSLTIESGTNILSSTASWAGTNIVVKSGAMLWLQGSGNLSANAHLQVEEGAFVKIDENVAPCVGKLTVGGKTMPSGYFSSAWLPDVIVGTGALAVGGRPVVWKGTKNASWNAASNWEPARVPGSGDVAVFKATATVAASGSPDEVSIPSGGRIVIYVESGTLSSYVKFSGKGALSICGGGQCKMLVASKELSGSVDVAIAKGLCVASPNNNTYNPLGTGDITIRSSYTGEENVFAGLASVSYGQTFSNKIHVVGLITNDWTYTSSKTYTFCGALCMQQTSFFRGAIDCDTDLLLESSDAVFNLYGNVTVPDGRTIRLWNRAITDDSRYLFNVYSTLQGDLQVECSRNSVVFNTTATCSGTNVVVKGESGLLWLKRATNLSEATVLASVDGGKVSIDSGVRQQVARFFIDGIEQKPGTYTKSNCNYVIGDGKLHVGHPGLILFFR